MAIAWREDVPQFVRNLTVGKLLADPELHRRVVSYLDGIGYQLVMPPDAARPTDDFLGGGAKWYPVDGSNHTGDITHMSYLVRRPTEHTRMGWFFFGRTRKKEKP